jgi:hypothetical protein
MSSLMDGNSMKYLMQDRGYDIKNITQEKLFEYARKEGFIQVGDEWAYPNSSIYFFRCNDGEKVFLEYVKPETRRLIDELKIEVYGEKDVDDKRDFIQHIVDNGISFREVDDVSLITFMNLHYPLVDPASFTYKRLTKDYMNGYLSDNYDLRGAVITEMYYDHVLSTYAISVKTEDGNEYEDNLPKYMVEANFGKWTE